MAGEWRRIRRWWIAPSYPRRFIAILLVVFRLNAEQVLDEFVELCVAILEKYQMDAPARTAALGVYIDKLLEKYDIVKEVRLLDTNVRSKGSKMYVIS